MDGERRVLGLWIVGWLAIGALDLGLGLNNAAPHEILTLAGARPWAGPRDD